MNYRKSDEKRLIKKSKRTFPSLKGTCHKRSMPSHDQIYGKSLQSIPLQRRTERLCSKNKLIE